MGLAGIVGADEMFSAARLRGARISVQTERTGDAQ